MAKNKVVTKLDGGLGNQMFQYAVGKSLALKNNSELLLDISSLSDKDEQQGTFIQRGYKLDVFRIEAGTVKEDQFDRIRNLPLNRLRSFIAKVFSTHFSLYFKAKNRMFDPRIFSLKGNIYIEGNWLSEKYFLEIREQLLEDFSYKNQATGKNKEIQDLILRQNNTVALHIRRSDYVTNPAASKHFAQLSLDYYYRALGLLEKQLGALNVFVFSDDVEWVKDNLKIEHNVTYCDHNDIEHGYEDLRLMISCQNFIIANSTFSWWGAWLSKAANKKVIAPNQWFADDISNKHEIIPSSWQKIPV